MTAGDVGADDAITELRALADVLLEKVEPWLRSGTAPTERADSAGDCGWCPLCALAAALRGQRPELTRRLAEQGAGWLTAVRALLEAHDSACAQPPRDEQDPPPRIQRIPVRDSGSPR